MKKVPERAILVKASITALGVRQRSKVLHVVDYVEIHAKWEVLYVE